MAEFAMDVAPVMDEVTLPDGVETLPEFIQTAVLGEVANRVMANIVASWPVDTGLSLAGFHVVPDGNSWQVKNDVDYTSFVHEGLVERLAQEGLAGSVTFAESLIKNLLDRQASPPGTRQRVSIDAQRQRARKVPDNIQQITDTLRAAGAAPEPVLDLYQQGRIGEALTLLSALLESHSVSVSAMISTAERLVGEGKVPKYVLAMLRSGDVRGALERLARNGKVSEAQAIARASI